MSTAWILCLLLLMIIPAIMVYAGYVRKAHCTQFGARHGYTTQLSLSSKEAWAHAQAACPKLYMVSGSVLAAAIALLMLVALSANTISVIIYGITLLLLELLVWSIAVCIVESGLRKLLGIKEA